MTPEEIKKIIKEKVEGVWEACHDKTGHKYRNTQTGYVVRSVTTKIGGVWSKPHLIDWAVRMGAEWLLMGDRLHKLQNELTRKDTITGMQMAHNDTKEDAGDVGTVAHNALERYINQFIADGKLPDNILVFMAPNADPRSIASARAAEKWFQKEQPIPIIAELLVGDEKLSAGQLDFLCIIKGELTLIDHKTSNGIDKEGYSMQVAAYKNFFEKMTGLKIKKSKILHLSKDSDKFDVWLVKNIPTAFKAFKNVCASYDWKYGKGEKIVRDIKRLVI